MCADASGGRDKDGGCVALRWFPLQPALGEITVAVRRMRLQALALADAFGGREADGDSSFSAEDVQVSLMLGEVAIRCDGDGVEDCGVMIGADEGADGAKECPEICRGVGEVG